MKRTCRECGSEKIMINVRVIDQQDSALGDLKVVVYGNPDALVFKDREFSKLRAYICGDCGHVELRALEPKALYDAYLRAHGDTNLDIGDNTP